MKPKRGLKELIRGSDFFLQDIKKIQTLIECEVIAEFQKRIDEFLIDRMFIQLNQE